MLVQIKAETGGILIDELTKRAQNSHSVGLTLKAGLSKKQIIDILRSKLTEVRGRNGMITIKCFAVSGEEYIMDGIDWLNAVELVEIIHGVKVIGYVILGRY